MAGVRSVLGRLPCRALGERGAVRGGVVGALQLTRQLGCSGVLRASEKYPPGPQARHFPIRTDTMLPAGSYAGKVVLVTGGGTGLGKGMATKFSQLGAKVAIASRRLPVLEAAAAEITQQTGGRVLPLQLDIRDPAAVKQAVDKVEAELGLPTVVIHNAAGNFISPTERLSANAFQTIIDIVLKGTGFLTLETGKRMIAAESGGVFLAITTHYTNEGSGFVVPSACAKSGVETMMKSLGAEWGRYGIRANCIAPGPIETEGAFGRLDPTGEGAKIMLEQIPVGRIGEIEEIANLTTFLCSDYGSWINAETVTLDGGEFRQLAGEFNKLRKITPEQWDIMEEIIRGKNTKSREQREAKPAAEPAPTPAATSTPAASAAPAAPAGGEGGDLIQSVFTKISAELSEDLVKKTGAVFAFKLTDQKTEWFLDLGSGAGSCGPGAPPRPADATLSMTSANFGQMFAGKLKPTAAFMSGRLKIQGNMGKAMKLEALMGKLK